VKLLNPDQKTYLIEIARSAEVIEAIQKRFPDSTTINDLLLIVITLIGWASIGFALYAEFSIGLNSPRVYIGSAIWAVCILYRATESHRMAERLAFSDLEKWLSKVDQVIGTPLAAKERRALAKGLLACASDIRRCRPFIRFRLHNHILSREAVRGSQALKQLVYPALLGSEEELRQLKEALARAAIRVGTGNWVQVGDLGTKQDKYASYVPLREPRLDFRGIGTVLLTLAPAIIGLIAAVVKY
jgi:hypothetical protein